MKKCEFANCCLHIVVKYAISFISKSSRSSGHCALSRVLGKDAEEGEHNECAEDKSEEIYADKHRVRKHGKYHAEKRKCAIKVGADEEHIEGFINSEDRESVVSSNVEKHSDKHHNNEDAHAAEEELGRKLSSVSYTAENTHKDLRAVVYHRLIVNAHDTHEHVVGIAENGKTCKEREGHHISYTTVAKLLVRGKCNNRKNIQGR